MTPSEQRERLYVFKCPNWGWPSRASYEPDEYQECEACGEQYEVMEVIPATAPSRERFFEDALRAITGPSDSGPFMLAYREAGGGYEGLQAIARAALEVSAEIDERAALAAPPAGGEE